jgi:putative phosphoribosyl transferase
MKIAHAAEVAHTAAIATEGIELAGDITLPEGASGVVVFAHGSGSSRHSPRNRMIARLLSDAGLGTLLLDLLTAEEEEHDLRTHRLPFNIPLLGRRVVAALDWLAGEPDTKSLRAGCFGASTGAAAALLAATERPERVSAVVSRGGRPDLAGSSLASVVAPTLLIVGGADPLVIELNREAQQQLKCESRVEIVPGATHLFPEPGALERVGELAREWFLAKLASEATPA